MADIKVETEVTGKVWQIATQPGDQVAEDDPVIILESMKMEIPVGAPADGTVKEILVAEGDMVEEGQAVALLEG